MAQQPRDRALDGLRGIAVLAVVLFHATNEAGAPASWSPLWFLPPLLGWSGVDLFFVLSGFLITRILVSQRDTDNYFRAFYGRRIVRIFPLYYAVLVLYFLVIPAFGSGRLATLWWGTPGEPLWYWFYLSNWVDGATGFFRHKFLAVAWSLAIEEQFYLMWPFVVRHVQPRKLERVCLAVIALSFAARLGGVLTGLSPVAVYVWTPMRLDVLAVGAYVALRVHREGGFDALSAWARRCLPVAGLVVVGIAGATLLYPHWLMERPTRMIAHPVMQTVGFSAVAIFYGSLLVLAMRGRGQLTRVLVSAPLRLAGRYSYAIYLLHGLAIFTWDHGIWAGHRAAYPFWANQALRYVAAVVLSTAVAAVTWRLIESPFLRLRSRFTYRNDIA